MRYLSFDIEATGLNENDYIIEFACLPFDVKNNSLSENLSFHQYIQCPPFEDLKHKLDPWVIKNNKTLIEKASQEGLAMSDFKNSFQYYLESEEIKQYFSSHGHQDVEKIILFGKSLNAIDLPFLNRDLGWDFMREYFHHQVLDLSSIVMASIDCQALPQKCIKGSQLMREFEMGEVAHTALEDAINTAKMYFKVLERLKA